MENQTSYANLSDDGIVIRIISEDLEYLNENYYGTWVDAFFNHDTKQRAEIGMKYDTDLQIFYNEELPDDTGYWVLDRNTGRYNNIKPLPDDRPDVKQWGWNHLTGEWEPYSSAVYKTDPRITSDYPNDGLYYRYMFKTDTWKRVEYIEDENGNYIETDVD